MDQKERIQALKFMLATTLNLLEQEGLDLDVITIMAEHRRRIVEWNGDTSRYEVCHD